MIIQHNLTSFNARNKLKANVSGIKKSSEKLSSGYRINRAGDDAAGLAVSEKMRGQIRGLNQAVRNSQDGINLIQTFEGALGETVAIIHRAKGLAEQIANGTYDDSVDRNAVELEYLHLCDEADQIAETDYNGIVMLSGKPESAENAAELESQINSTMGNRLVTVSETSAQIAAPDIEAAVTPYAAEPVSYAAANTGGVTCGDFTVYGNSSNFSFDMASGVLTILGGDVTVEGTGAATTNTIVVAKDKSANVTLKNVNIDVSGTDNACAFKIEDDSMGDVTVTLEGNNVLKSGGKCAGLQKNGGRTTGTLYLEGHGTLNAVGGRLGAGIGGGHYQNGYNIVINNGIISAISLGDGAGIGGGENGDGQNIEINDGKVTAVSQGGYGAGIGGGDFGNGIEIYINGGEIKAVSSCDHGDGSEVGHAAAIGGGLKGYGKIYISGGKITAEASYSGAAIGGGSSNGGLGVYKSEVTICGGQIVAISNLPCCDRTQNSIFNIRSGAGIGGGDDGYAKIVIGGNDTVVIAKGGNGAYNIGSGADGAASSLIISDDLTSEPYTGNGIVDGTIVHYTGKKPDTPTPDNPGVPDKPGTPDDLDTFIVSVPNAFGNATAKLTYTDELTLQVGARTKDAVNFTFNYSADGIGELNADLNCTAKGLGMDALTLKTQESANYAIDQLDHALNKVSKIRATFGAAQNRLEHKITNLANSGENLTEAESSIRDTDMASEMMKYTKFNILQQAAQSMLSQANQMPQSTLQILG